MYFLFYFIDVLSPPQHRFTHYQHFMADNHHLILKIHQTFLNCFTPFFKKASFTNTNLFLSLSCFQFSSGFLLGVKRTNLITMTFGALKSTCVPSSLVQLTSQLPSSMFSLPGAQQVLCISTISCSLI